MIMAKMAAKQPSAPKPSMMPTTFKTRLLAITEIIIPTARIIIPKMKMGLRPSLSERANATKEIMVPHINIMNLAWLRSASISQK